MKKFRSLKNDKFFFCGVFIYLKVLLLFDNMLMNFYFIYSFIFVFFYYGGRYYFFVVLFFVFCIIDFGIVF